MNLEIFGAYFTSTWTLLSILIPFCGMLLLYAAFRRTENPRSRSQSLGAMLFASIFMWVFIGLSLALCYVFADSYEYQLAEGAREVLGRALLLSVAAGVPLTFLLRRASPRIVLSKVRGLHAPQECLTKQFHALANHMGVPDSLLQISSNPLPVSFALQTEKPIVVMSDSLLSLLTKDEVEAVMAHELAHIKNSDTSLKALVTAYKTAIPQDPLIRLVEAAFHREREMVADETASKVTGKPLSLASALLKIYEAFPKTNLQSYGTLSILGASSTLMSRHPSIGRRVNRLIRLAESPM